MAATQFTVEFKLGDGDALAAYGDASLDSADSITLEHATGALSASVQGSDGSRRNVPCGTVSLSLAEGLKRYATVLWCRTEGGRRIQVGEVALVHA